MGSRRGGDYEVASEMNDNYWPVSKAAKLELKKEVIRGQGCLNLCVDFSVLFFLSSVPGDAVSCKYFPSSTPRAYERSTQSAACLSFK